MATYRPPSEFYQLGDIGDGIIAPDRTKRVLITSFEKISGDECITYISFVNQFLNREGIWKDSYKKARGNQTDAKDQFGLRMDMLGDFLKELNDFVSQKIFAKYYDPEKKVTYQMSFQQMLARIHIDFQAREKQLEQRLTSSSGHANAPSPPPERRMPQQTQAHSATGSGYNQPHPQQQERRYPSTGSAPTAPTAPSQPPARGYDPYQNRPAPVPAAPVQDEFPMQDQNAGFEPDPF